MPTDPGSTLPTADLAPQRRVSGAWIVTIMAVAFAIWLGYRGWIARGLVITVQLANGHGLKPHDPVKYNGIAVGEVRTVELAKDLQHVVVTAALDNHAAELAKTGARIWVVRPQLGASGIAGLETIVGPRYLAILPGAGTRQREFVGLSEPPAVEEIAPGDLEIIVEAASRGGIRAGAPVLYRQMHVGTILSVGLSSDARAVEARLHIPQAFTQLIRPETKFWRVGGFQTDVGITGVSIAFESVEALLAGGVALATPPDAGDVVRNGHRFFLYNEPNDDWLEWRPLVAIGSSFLPAGAALPSPLRAVLGWKSGRWIKSEKTRRGWVLPTEQGLLGPLDLLKTKADAGQDSVVLEIAGQTIPLTEVRELSGGLALLSAQLEGSIARWPASRMRKPAQPEDCIAIADPASPPLPLTAARLTARLSATETSVWQIDPTVHVDESWHGAAVLSRADGALLGLILVNDDKASVALVAD